MATTEDDDANLDDRYHLRLTSDVSFVGRCLGCRPLPPAQGLNSGKTGREGLQLQDSWAGINPKTQAVPAKSLAVASG